MKVKKIEKLKIFGIFHAFLLVLGNNYER